MTVDMISDGSQVINSDPWLEPFKDHLNYRYSQYLNTLDGINKNFKGLDNFSKGYEYFGFNIDEKTGDIVYREWAPNAKEAFLMGDFNGWNSQSHPMNCNEYGVWEIYLKSGTIPHGSRIKIFMRTKSGQSIDRIPAWSRRVIQDLSKSPLYDAVYWHPTERFVFKHQRPSKPKELIIYEAHVGISSPDGKICSYSEFSKNILPRIAYLGYNCIQLMAIMEHA
jgi:1,4-alpha-glucan branching enzyme